MYAIEFYLMCCVAVFYSYTIGDDTSTTVITLEYFRNEREST